MIGGNVNEFIDTLTTGQELVFKYKGQTYCVQGNTTDGVWTATLARWEPWSEEYVWTADCNSMKICAEEFLKAAIFDGLSFWQIEKEIEWIEG